MRLKMNYQLILLFICDQKASYYVKLFFVRVYKNEYIFILVLVMHNLYELINIYYLCR